MQEMVREEVPVRSNVSFGKEETTTASGWWWSGSEWWGRKFPRSRQESVVSKGKSQSEDDWSVGKDERKGTVQSHRHTHSEAEIGHVQLQIDRNEIEPPSVYTTLKDDRRLLEETKRKLAYLEQRNEELTQRVEGLQEALHVERAQKIKAQRTLEHMDNMLDDMKSHKNKLVRTNERLQYDNFQLGALQMKYDQSKASVRELLRKVDELQDEKEFMLREGMVRQCRCFQEQGRRSMDRMHPEGSDAMDYNRPGAFPGSEREDGLPVVALSKLRI